MANGPGPPMNAYFREFQAGNNRSMLTIGYNLSGALEAVKMERFVVIVDVIDMSTTLEAVREAGALACWGAAPVGRQVDVTAPFKIGQAAAREALSKGAELVVIAEPRAGRQDERRRWAGDVLKGAEAEGSQVREIWPNLGAETATLTDWTNKVAVAVTAAGGTIFDAVWQAGGSLTTATVARVPGLKGQEPAQKGITRALALAGGRPITLIAASSNALEDVLAVQYLAQQMLPLLT